MTKLVRYIIEHTTPVAIGTPDSVSVHFFAVVSVNNPTKEELLSILQTEYPDMERIKGGPSYIEIGAELGSQEIALQLIGLGGLVKLWPVVTPTVLKITGAEADELAGKGLVMAGGFE